MSGMMVMAYNVLELVMMTTYSVGMVMVTYRVGMLMVTYCVGDVDGDCVGDGLCDVL